MKETTNICVLRECAEKIARRLDDIDSVIGTGVYVVTDPPWEDANLGYIHCETVVKGKDIYLLHEVYRFLRDNYDIESSLAAGRWCRWEWSIHSCQKEEYVLPPNLEDIS